MKYFKHKPNSMTMYSSSELVVTLDGVTCLYNMFVVTLNGVTCLYNVFVVTLNGVTCLYNVFVLTLNGVTCLYNVFVVTLNGVTCLYNLFVVTRSHWEPDRPRYQYTTINSYHRNERQIVSLSGVLWIQLYILTCIQYNTCEYICIH